MTTTTALLLLLGAFFLVAMNGFFVVAEFALVSVRRSRIDELVAQEIAWPAWSAMRSVIRPVHCRHPTGHHPGQPGPGLDRRAGLCLAADAVA